MAIATNPSSAQVRPPLCRWCHKEMTLVSIQPHARYANLDDCRFKCTCGGVADAVIARPLGQLAARTPAAQIKLVSETPSKDKNRKVQPN